MKHKNAKQYSLPADPGITPSVSSNLSPALSLVGNRFQCSEWPAFFENPKREKKLFRKGTRG